MYTCANCGVAFDGAVCPNCSTLRPTAAVIGQRGKVLSAGPDAAHTPGSHAAWLAEQLELSRELDAQRRREAERREHMRRRAAELAIAAEAAELLRQAEEERRTKEDSLEEEAHRAEERRLEEEKRLAEQARLAEEKRLAEQARLAEEKRARESLPDNIDIERYNAQARKAAKWTRKAPAARRTQADDSDLPSVIKPARVVLGKQSAAEEQDAKTPSSPPCPTLPKAPSLPTPPAPSSRSSFTIPEVLVAETEAMLNTSARDKKNGADE